MRRRAALVALLGLLPAACSTRRTLTIDSEPSGAQLWVDGRPLGRTPAEVPFVHYRSWAVRLEKEGYEALATEVRVRSEIDGYPVVDLPFELLVREKSWRRVLPLTPLAPRPDDAALEEVLGRAKAFRARTGREVAEPGTPRPSRRRPAPPVVQAPPAGQAPPAAGDGR